MALSDIAQYAEAYPPSAGRYHMTYPAPPAAAGNKTRQMSRGRIRGYYNILSRKRNTCNLLVPGRATLPPLLQISRDETGA